MHGTININIKVHTFR